MTAAGASVLLVIWASVAVGSPCEDFYNQASPPRHVAASVAARGWCSSGKYFNFTSRVNPGAVEQRVFYRCGGSPDAPAMVLGHGWPTSSFDFLQLSEQLESKFFVCAVDYVGHGFSDKPTDPEYQYSMTDHSWVVEDLVTRVLGLKSFSYLTHDEGDSVGFILLKRYAQYESRGDKPFHINHHIILNGGIYLPLAHLSEMQTVLLSNPTGPALQRTLTGPILADGMAVDVYSPSLNKTERDELATVFDYQSGTHVMHGTIQYLVERHEHEVEWLQVLGNCSVSATLVWGGKDPVAVPAVGDYVWTNYLANRTSAPSTYHKVPEANHYIQVDHVDVIAQIVLNETLRHL